MSSYPLRKPFFRWRGLPFSSRLYFVYQCFILSTYITVLKGDPDPWLSSSNGSPLYTPSNDAEDPLFTYLTVGIPSGGISEYSRQLNFSSTLSPVSSTGGGFHSWLPHDPSRNHIGPVTVWSYSGGYDNFTNINWPFKVLVPKVDYWSPSTFPIPLHWKKIENFILPLDVTTGTGSSNNASLSYIDSTVPSSLPYTLPLPPIDVTGSVTTKPGWITGQCSLPRSVYDDSRTNWNNNVKNNNTFIDTIGVHVWLTNLGSPELPWSREYLAYPFDVWLTIPSLGSETNQGGPIRYNFSIPLLDLNFYQKEQFMYSDPPPFTTQPGVPWTKDAILRENMEASLVHFFPSRFPFHRRRLQSRHPYVYNATLPSIDLYMNGTAQWFLLCNSFVVYRNGTRRVSEYIIMDNFNPYTSTQDHQGVWSQDTVQMQNWSHKLNGNKPVGWWGTQIAFSDKNHSQKGCTRSVLHGGFTNPTPTSYGQCFFQPESNIRYSSTAVGMNRNTQQQLYPYFYLPFTVTMSDWHLDDNYYGTSTSVKYACLDNWLDGYVNGISGGCPLYAQGNGWFLTWGQWEYNLLNRNFFIDNNHNISYGTTVMNNQIISPGMMWLPGLYSQGSKYNRYTFPTMHRQEKFSSTDTVVNVNVPHVFLHRIKTVAHITSVSGRNIVYPDWYSAWAWVIAEITQVNPAIVSTNSLPLPFRKMEEIPGKWEGYRTSMDNEKETYLAVPFPESLYVFNAPGENQPQINDIVVKCTIPSPRAMEDQTIVRTGAHIWLATIENLDSAWMGDIWSMNPIDNPFQQIHYGIITLGDLRNYYGNYSYGLFEWEILCSTVLQYHNGSIHLSEPRYMDDPINSIATTVRKVITENIDYTYRFPYFRNILATNQVKRIGKSLLLYTLDNGTDQETLDHRPYFIDPPTNASFEINERNSTLFECSSKVTFRFNMPNMWRNVWITEVVIESLSAYLGFLQPWLYTFTNLPTPEAEEYTEFIIYDNKSSCGLPNVYRMYLRGYWPQGNSLWKSTKYSDVVVLFSNTSANPVTSPTDVYQISKQMNYTLYTGVPQKFGKSIDESFLRGLSNQYDVFITVTFTECTIGKDVLIRNNFLEENGLYIFNVSAYPDLKNIPFDVFAGIWFIPSQIRTLGFRYEIDLVHTERKYQSSYIVKEIITMVAPNCEKQTSLTVNGNEVTCSNVTCENGSNISLHNFDSVIFLNVTWLPTGLFLFSPASGLQRACALGNISCPSNWEPSYNRNLIVESPCVPSVTNISCAQVVLANASIRCINLPVQYSVTNSVTKSWLTTHELVNRSSMDVVCDAYGTEWCRSGYCSCYSSFEGIVCDTCRNGYWGSFCNLPCNCSQTSGSSVSSCHRWTGQCSSCDTATFGLTCSNSILQRTEYTNSVTLLSTNLLHDTIDATLGIERNISLLPIARSILHLDATELRKINTSAIESNDLTFLPYWMCFYSPSPATALLSSLVPSQSLDTSRLSSLFTRFLVPLSFRFNSSTLSTKVFPTIVLFHHHTLYPPNTFSQSTVEIIMDRNLKVSLQRGIHFRSTRVPNDILFMHPTVDCSQSIARGWMNWTLRYSRNGLEEIVWSRSSNTVFASNITCIITLFDGRNISDILRLNFVSRHDPQPIAVRSFVRVNDANTALVPLPPSLVIDEEITILQNNCSNRVSLFRDTVTNDIFLFYSVRRATLCTFLFPFNNTFDVEFLPPSSVPSLSNNLTSNRTLYGTIDLHAWYLLIFPYNLTTYSKMLPAPSSRVIFRAFPYDLLTAFPIEILPMHHPFSLLPSTESPNNNSSNISYSTNFLGNGTHSLPRLVSIYGTHIFTVKDTNKDQAVFGILESDTNIEQIFPTFSTTSSCQPGYTGPFCTECAIDYVLVIDRSSIHDIVYECQPSTSASLGIFVIQQNFLPDSDLRKALSVLTLSLVLSSTTNISQIALSMSLSTGSLYQDRVATYLIISFCSLSVFTAVFIFSYRRISRILTPFAESSSSTSISNIHSTEETINYYENQYYVHNSISKSSFSTRIARKKLRTTDNFNSDVSTRIAFPPVSSNMVTVTTRPITLSTNPSLSGRSPGPTKSVPTLKNILSLWRIRSQHLENTNEESIPNKNDSNNVSASSMVSSNVSTALQPTFSPDRPQETTDALLTAVSVPSATIFEENVHLSTEIAAIRRAALPFRTSQQTEGTKALINPQTIRKPKGLLRIRRPEPHNVPATLSSSSSSTSRV